MLASCQESREEAMLRLVNEWNGKEIKFPSRSVFTVQGRDTVDFEFRYADYKVVTYIDSTVGGKVRIKIESGKSVIGWIHGGDRADSEKVVAVKIK